MAGAEVADEMVNFPVKLPRGLIAVLHEMARKGDRTTAAEIRRALARHAAKAGYQA